jgi:hypothetical protein
MKKNYDYLFDPTTPCVRVQYTTTELKRLMSVIIYLRYLKKTLRPRDLYSLKLKLSK